MHAIKVVLVGDMCVGKTALWVAYEENKLYTELIPTVFDTYSINVNIAGDVYHLSVFDTSGAEDYDRLRPLSYPNTDVIVVVFSVGKPWSYENVTAKWIPEVKHHMPNVPILLVGNQIDLRTDPYHLEQLAKRYKEPITTVMGQMLGRKINAVAYVESSCLDKRGVTTVFVKAIKISQQMPVKFCDTAPSLYIFMMGDSDVGKTTLANAYLDNRIDDHSPHLSNYYRSARSSIDNDQYIMYEDPLKCWM